MKYLVIGAGGVGGSLACYMYRAGLDITVAVRAQSFEAISRDGLVFSETGTEQQRVPVKVICTDDDLTSYDVAFLCVKDYSLESVFSCLDRLSGTCLVIPIMNGLSGVSRINMHNKDILTCDACAYLSASRTGKNIITKLDPGFKIVLQAIDGETVEIVAMDLISAGIKVKLSKQIGYDKILKFYYISPLSACQAYFEYDYGQLKKEKSSRELFLALSCELKEAIESNGIKLPYNCVEVNMARLDKMPDSGYTSFAKDYIEGKKFEKRVFIDDVISLGAQSGIEMRLYKLVNERLISGREGIHNYA